MTDKVGGGRPKRGPAPSRRPSPAGSDEGRDSPAGRPLGAGRSPTGSRPERRPRGGTPGPPADLPGASAKPSPLAIRPPAHPPAARGPATQHPSPPRGQEDSPRTLLELYRPDLTRILEAADAAGFRYAQVLEHLLRHPGRAFSDASALPADLRSALEEAGASVLSLAATRRARDGTTKLLLATGDGSHIEAVLIPYGNRLTVCISSQVGCAVGCAFCATGAMGFRRNLTTAEIVDQLRAAGATADDGQRISNVVYMGMGEPLLNLGAVLDSVRVFTAPAGLALGHRALSVSTVGIPSGILRLARTEPQVNLALSLHAADDSTRALLVPAGFRRPLAEILEAAWQHFEMTRRKLLVEYVLIAGVNDSADDAKRLAALLRGHVVTVNLLAWNPVRPAEVDRGGVKLGGVRQNGPVGRAGSRPRFLPSSPAAVAAFRAALRAAHVEAIVRQSKGAGIEAACGQLAGAEGSYDKD